MKLGERECIEVSPEQLMGLDERARQGPLSEEQQQVLEGAIHLLVHLSRIAGFDL